MQCAVWCWHLQVADELQRPGETQHLIADEQAHCAGWQCWFADLQHQMDDWQHQDLDYQQQDVDWQQQDLDWQQQDVDWQHQVADWQHRDVDWQHQAAGGGLSAAERQHGEEERKAAKRACDCVDVHLSHKV